MVALALSALLACGKTSAWRDSVMVWGGEADLARARRESKPVLLLFCLEGTKDCADEISFQDHTLRLALQGDVVPVRIAVPVDVLPASDGRWEPIRGYQIEAWPRLLVLDEKGTETARFVAPFRERPVADAVDEARRRARR